MDVVFRIFMIIFDILAVLLCSFLLISGVAVWWAVIDFLAKCLLSISLILAGLVFGFIIIWMTIISW